MKTLFVVDMQKDFLLNDGKLNLGHDTKGLRERIGSFIKEFKGHVALTQDTHDADSCEFAAFPPHCLIETEGWELVDEVISVAQEREPINPMQDGIKGENTVEIIFKRSFSGMGLYWTLDKAMLESEIHVVGVCGHICVHDLVVSVVNFAKEKYNLIPKIILHKDMVDDFDKDAQEFAIKRLTSLYGVTIV